MSVIAGCFAVEAKTTFRDGSKPKCAGNYYSRCDDRESQNKVSEEVHWRIAPRYPLLKKLAKRKKVRSSPEERNGLRLDTFQG